MSTETPDPHAAYVKAETGLANAKSGFVTLWTIASIIGAPAALLGLYGLVIESFR